MLIFINNTNANKISIKFKVENEIITSQDVNNELIYLRLLNNKLNNLNKKKSRANCSKLTHTRKDKIHRTSELL